MKLKVLFLSLETGSRQIRGATRGAFPAPRVRRQLGGGRGVSQASAARVPPPPSAAAAALGAACPGAPGFAPDRALLAL